MDAGSDKPSQTISGAAASCIELFNGCLAKDPDAFAMLEEEERRFWAVLNSLKVFASPKINLDAQLRSGKHPQIREMVLLLLKVLMDNLSLALKSDVSQETAVVTRSVLEIPLFGIDGSLKRLEKVSAAIIQATQASLTRRVIAFAQRESNKHDCERITRTFSMAILTRYRGLGPPDMPMFGIPPEVIPSPDQILTSQPMGLFLALVKTFVVRHFRASYERKDNGSQNKKAPTQSHGEEEEQESGPDTTGQGKQQQSQSTPQKASQSSQSRDETQSETKTNPLSLQTNVFKEKMGEASTSGPRGRRPVSEAGAATYPQPPKIMDGQTDAVCPICKRVQPVHVFEGPSWISHVNADIKPYVCISEDCMKNLQFFEDSSSWINHMHKTHTTRWIRYLFNAYTWTCPICHEQSTTEFDSKWEMEQSLIVHFGQEHSDVIEESNRQDMANVSGVPRHRPMDICPICGDHHQVKTVVDASTFYDQESRETSGKGVSRSGESRKAVVSAKRARFNVPTRSDGEETKTTARATVGPSIQPSKPAPFTGVEKCIGDHLKALAFYFSDRLIEDENETDNDDGYKYSAASKRSADSRLIALLSLPSVGSNADPPQFPSGGYDGPPITDKEKEEAKNCITTNSNGLLTDSYDWDESRRLTHTNISREDMEDIFPDIHRQSNERIWKGMEPRFAIIYTVCILIVLELCETAILSTEGNKNDAKMTISITQLKKQLTDFSNVLPNFTVHHPCGRILEVVEECALDCQPISARLLSNLQKTTNDEIIAQSKEDKNVIQTAKRRMELCIVLADINSQIGDLWTQYLETTKASFLNADQWGQVEKVLHVITSRDPAFLDILRATVEEYLTNNVELDLLVEQAELHKSIKGLTAISNMMKEKHDEATAKLGDISEDAELEDSSNQVKASDPGTVPFVILNDAEDHIHPAIHDEGEITYSENLGLRQKLRGSESNSSEVEETEIDSTAVMEGHGISPIRPLRDTFFDEEGDTVDDLGEHLYKLRNRVRVSPSVTTGDPREPLQDRLIDSLCGVPGYPEKKGFLPRDMLASLVDEDCVIGELKIAYENVFDNNTIRLYAREICGISRISPTRPQPLFKKIFVILVLCEKTSSIIKFLRENISDDDLPLVKAPRPRKPSGKFDLALATRPKVPLNAFSDWTTVAIRGFEEWQWTTISPFFSRGTGRRQVYHYNLPDQSILPFISDSRSDLDHDKLEFDGGLSQVFKVDIHSAHHDFHDTHMSNRSFAIKCLLSRDKEDFYREVEMLKKFSGNSHDHMVSLLATYEQLRKFYLIFPWADANLLRFWKDINPNPTVDRKTIIWMAEQCRGLANALSKIHLYEEDPIPKLLRSETSIDSGDFMGPGLLFGGHGNIKPENVLLFMNPDMPETPGTLKLTDFGLAEFSATESKTYHRNSNVARSPSYRPPECDLEGSSAIGRSYDIWTLGCLYLDFATWLLGGWELLDVFTFKRITNDPHWLDMPTDTFFEIVKDRHTGASAAMIKPSVTDFFFELHAHPACSEYMHEFLNLIQFHLMIVKPNEPDARGRFNSQELDRSLSEMFRICKADEDYASKPVPWSKRPKEPTRTARSGTELDFPDPAANPRLKDERPPL